MSWNPPNLRSCAIALSAPASIGDPIKFLCEHLDDDAVVVVESTDSVKVLRLSKLVIDDRTLHLHGFSNIKKSQARAARAGWASPSWCADAVCECATGSEGSVDAKAREGQHLCLGKVRSSEGAASTLSEARTKPYTLPMALPVDAGATVSFVDYFTSDDTGRLNCTAHRVVEIGQVRDARGQL